WPPAARWSRRTPRSTSSSRPARDSSPSPPWRRQSTPWHASTATTRRTAPPRGASRRRRSARSRAFAGSSPTPASPDRTVRVVVTGLAATYPVGGVAWDYLQYVQGFAALGCDVLYLEDTGQWFYDPAAATFTPDPEAGAAYLAQALDRLMPGA